MVEINPPFAMQNAGPVHTAEVDRLALGALIGGVPSITSMRPRGGVQMHLGSSLSTTQTGTPSMAVQVFSGVCYVPGTEGTRQGVYFCINDASVTLPIAAAHGTLPRIDTVVARVYDSFYSGATNEWKLEVVTGTAASSPVAPTLPANSLALFNVSVAAAVSSIVNANIVDVRQYLTAVGGVMSTTGRPAADTAYDGMVIYYRPNKTIEVFDASTSSWVVRSSAHVTQTGSVSVTFSNKNSHTQVVNFPSAFASIPKVALNINTGAGPSSRWAARAFNITATSFTLFLYYASDDTTLFSWPGYEVQWTAVAP